MKKNTKLQQSKRNNTVTKQQVRAMIKSDKVELVKYIDTIVDFAATSNNETTTTLNLPGLGTGQNSRTGDSIVIDHFEIRTTHFLVQTGTANNDTCFFRDMLYQNCGEALINTSADILDNVSTTDNKINSNVSYSNKGKLFKLLLDTRNQVDVYNPASLHYYKRIRPSIPKMRYNSVDAEWSTGVPNLLNIGFNTNVIAGSTYYSEYIIRMWFYDV